MEKFNIYLPNADHIAMGTIIEKLEKKGFNIDYKNSIAKNYDNIYSLNQVLEEETPIITEYIINASSSDCQFKLTIKEENFEIDLENLALKNSLEMYEPVSGFSQSQLVGELKYSKKSSYNINIIKDIFQNKDEKYEKLSLF